LVSTPVTDIAGTVVVNERQLTVRTPSREVTVRKVARGTPSGSPAV
jgi:hypothetical protein